MKEKYRKLLLAAKAITEKAISEDRSLTDEEKAQITNLMEEAKRIKADIEMSEQIDAMDAALGQQEEVKRQKFNGTISDRFLNDPAYKAWFEQIAPNGKMSEQKKGLQSPTVEIGKTGLFKKDLVMGADATSAGAFVVPQDTGIYEPLGRYPTVLRDLISVRQTGSDSVEFVQQVTQVTEAEPVAEANVATAQGYTGEVLGKKPEGGMTFIRVTEPVKTIAVWIPATKRALSDAAQIRGIIDQELREDLADELESQMFTGDGVGENFTGLEHQANVLIQAYSTDLLTTTRKALTYLKRTGKTIPTGWVFSPEDWETFELLKDKNDRFYGNGPWAAGPKTLWSLPVVESFHVTAGNGWLANWRKGVLWDREEASISVSDSHDDFFIRNLVAILGEMRAAFGLIRPSGFCKVDLTA